MLRFLAGSNVLLLALAAGVSFSVLGEPLSAVAVQQALQRNAVAWRGVGRSWPRHLQPARCSGHRPCKLGPLARKINDDVNKVLALPDVQERLDTYGAEDGGGSMEKVAQFIRSETAKWAKVVKDGNIKVDS